MTNNEPVALDETDNVRMIIGELYEAVDELARPRHEEAKVKQAEQIAPSIADMFGPILDAAPKWGDAILSMHRENEAKMQGLQNLREALSMPPVYDLDPYTIDLGNPNEGVEAAQAETNKGIQAIEANLEMQIEHERVRALADAEKQMPPARRRRGGP